MTMDNFFVDCITKKDAHNIRAVDNHILTICDVVYGVVLL